MLPAPNPPLKRPSLGRPRGRPPGPKIPGSSRPRGRPNLSMNATYWQNQMLKTNAVYDYMKHYQDELIRQYSKTLTLNQLAQIGQYFNQTSLANQFNMPSTSQNPLLSQAHMMNAFAEGLKKKSTADTFNTKTTAVDPRMSQTGINPLNYIPSTSSRMQPISMQSSTKSAFTMPVLTTAASVGAPHKYTTAELSKPKTKTTFSYQQAFLVICIIKVTTC